MNQKLIRKSKTAQMNANRCSNLIKEALLLEDTLKIKVIRHLRKKPEVRDDIYKHFNLSLDSNQKHTNIAMIGDRILADTVMGHQHGFFTIDTQPFTTKNENFMVKMSRKIEAHLLPSLSSKDPPHHEIFDKISKKELSKEIILS
ncbi:UNKNOWN [Stylonychia lemnae]|uniref:Uncharacterized protein n=1 Tax=Stylonychia lemnae TaxID=5949 RepID=A0A078APD1_STYLE|nr:UNKNOWN [Stylonychia lemnae]|eukprot:CDW84225.1 UNKNOWN [Stylonychia lemnae]